MRGEAPTPPTPRGQSINSLLVLSFVIVALVPVSILGIKSYYGAWENAWREVQEKHQSLAENLAAPISQYLDDRRIALAQLKEKVTALGDVSDPAQTTPLLAEGLGYLNGFRAVFLLDEYQRIIDYTGSYPLDPAHAAHFSLGVKRYLNSLFESGQILISPVVMNPFTGRTTLLIGTVLKSPAPDGHPILLIGELKIAVIEELRRGIHFGEQGHSAIVDQLGQVIAHPNPDWMSDHIKDLSKLSIVQKMMAGETGVTEFYSPFKKADMVAGYTAVPNAGWGVMVPQPKSEVEAQVERVRGSELTWALVGIALALAFGLALARWITRPVNALVHAGQHLDETDFEGALPKICANAPREIQLLSNTLGGAVARLMASRTELADLNRSLQVRVDEATHELRTTNSKLQHLAQSDHLTQLANRRHFEYAVASLASRRQSDSLTICLLLLDVDKFKNINDRYGHAAGDEILKQIGDILRQNLRKSDLAARYAGDEFVVLLRADLEVGRQCARQLCAAIDAHEFTFGCQILHTTVSIGLVCCETLAGEGNPDYLLRQVDDAMYEAKRQGRNCIAEVPPAPGQAVQVP